jgi:hypothetical protein
MRSLLPLSLLLFWLGACSSDGGSSSGGSSGGGSSGGGSSGGTAFTCGTETCNPSTSYCSLTPQGKELVASGCKPFPTGCKAPKNDASCQPRDPAECAQAGRPISECLNVPPECSAQTTCDCIGKSKDCPQSGTILTSCKGKNDQVSFACYRG